MFTPKMEDNFGLLKKLILMHSVDSPPASAVFDIDDVQVITDFMSRTFYR